MRAKELKKLSALLDVWLDKALEAANFLKEGKFVTCLHKSIPLRAEIAGVMATLPEIKGLAPEDIALFLGLARKYDDALENLEGVANVFRLRAHTQKVEAALDAPIVARIEQMRETHLSLVKSLRPVSMPGLRKAWAQEVLLPPKRAVG